MVILVVFNGLIFSGFYICIPAIDIDSVLKADKKTYPQVYFEQGKYKLKKRKRVNYIDLEIIDYDSENDSENDSDSNIKMKLKMKSKVKIKLKIFHYLDNLITS